MGIILLLLEAEGGQVLDCVFLGRGSSLCWEELLWGGGSVEVK